MVQHLDVQDVPLLAVITKPVTRTHAGTGCAQNWRRVKSEENILPEDRHVWMQGNRRNPLHQATNVLCQRNGIAHQKNASRMGEEDVTMRQDITATSGASSSSASRGPAMDVES